MSSSKSKEKDEVNTVQEDSMRRHLIKREFESALTWNEKWGPMYNRKTTGKNQAKVLQISM